MKTMKKIGILAIVLLLGLASCGIGTRLYARHFKYNGHCYIEFFRNLPSYDNYTGYVHDPDCPCMKK